MRITLQPRFVSRRQARVVKAMTLLEILIAMGLFSLVLIAVLSAQMFGMLQDQLVNSKLGASDQSRRAFNKMTGEIRSAKIWMIGNGDDASFKPIVNGQQQQGNAIQVSHTTDTNSYVRYYFETNSQELRRVQCGVEGHSVIAQYLTNNMYFRAEDYLGNIKTDLSYKYVIRITMEFCQYQYPLTKVGPGNYYDYYKLEFKVTPHCPDGA
jgi:hypothetical protein